MGVAGLNSVSECQSAGVALWAGVAQRLDVVPSKIALECAAASDPAVVQEIIKTALHKERGDISEAQIVRPRGPLAGKLDALLAKHRDEVQQLLGNTGASPVSIRGTS